LGYQTARRIVEIEVDKRAARFIHADVQDHLTRRRVDEDD
jgi:hypothetical protein